VTHVPRAFRIFLLFLPPRSVLLKFRHTFIRHSGRPFACCFNMTCVVSRFHSAHFAQSICLDSACSSPRKWSPPCLSALLACHILLRPFNPIHFIPPGRRGSFCTANLTPPGRFCSFGGANSVSSTRSDSFYVACSRRQFSLSIFGAYFVLPMLSTTFSLSTLISKPCRRD